MFLFFLLTVMRITSLFILFIGLSAFFPTVHAEIDIRDPILYNQAYHTNTSILLATPTVFLLSAVLIFIVSYFLCTLLYKKGFPSLATHKKITFSSFLPLFISLISSSFVFVLFLVITHLLGTYRMSSDMFCDTTYSLIVIFLSVVLLFPIFFFGGCIALGDALYHSPSFATLSHTQRYCIRSLEWILILLLPIAILALFFTFIEQPPLWFIDWSSVIEARMQCLF